MAVLLQSGEAMWVQFSGLSVFSDDADGDSDNAAVCAVVRAVDRAKLCRALHIPLQVL